MLPGLEGEVGLWSESGCRGVDGVCLLESKELAYAINKVVGLKRVIADEGRRGERTGKAVGVMEVLRWSCETAVPGGTYQINELLAR